MSTSVTWPGGGTGATATAYSIPAAGELNWAALSNFLVALGQGAQSTVFQLFAIRKATTTPVTVAVTDCIVGSKLGSPAAVAMNLPAGVNKQVFFLFDDTGDAGTNNITITPNGSDTIGGSASLVLSHNREGVILCYNSGDTDWKIVHRSAPLGSIKFSDLPALNNSVAVVTNGSGVITSSSTTATQIGYLASATGTTGTTSTNVVFSTSPTLVTPILGTPQSGNLSNCTALSLTTGVSGTLPIANGGTAVTSLTSPTQQSFTSGSGTYTTPAGVKWIRVRAIGAGGGGGGSTTIAGSYGTAAGAGGNTTFGTTLIAANGGGGALNGSNGANPGASGTGGSASTGAAVGIALAGGAGVSGGQSAAAMNGTGGAGGPSAFGGAGIGATSAGTGVAGGNGVANTGGGGAGASLGSTAFTGAGGAAGGFVDAIISGPSATYSYAVGAGGTAGAAGTSGAAGGTGGSGYIIVEEHYFM